MININKKYYNFSGIYYIVNIESYYVYVGSAVILGKRIKEHRNSLRRNKHKNIHLQHAFNKYGEDKFIVILVELLYNKSALLEREQHYINIQKNIFKKSYNINPIAGSSFGYKHSDETIKHLSNLKLGEKNPQYGNVGSKNPNSKLTIEDVRFIRNNFDKYSYAELGRKYGVSYVTISRIIKNKNWINL